MKPKNKMIRRVKGLFGLGIVSEVINILEDDNNKESRLRTIKVFIGPFVINFHIKSDRKAK